MTENKLITTMDDLAAFCDRLETAEFVTVDTEFMRETTYRPILCVIQIAGPDEAFAIDALAPDLNLDPVYKLFDNPDIVKVFHAARQDLEIFYSLSDRLPSPLFDTQIAAMVCGFGDSIGYQQLIAKLCKTHIDKGSRFSDWSLRPLSAKQIDYAISDVTHLQEAYQKLHQKLIENGREPWIAEEMDILKSPDTYRSDPENAFRRIKARSVTPRFLAILQRLAAWREREAERRDVPRNRIVKDDTLVDIAHQKPATARELGKTRGISSKTADGKYGEQILAAIKQGLATPDDQCPKPMLKPDLPRGIGPVSDLLKVLLKMKTENENVAGKLLASAADMELIAAFGEDADVRCLKGWRRELFGEDALKLCAGKLALVVRGREIILVDTPEK